MDIIGGISAATEGLKLLNELRTIDKEVDKADLKLRLVELADKLLDAKQALLDAQEAQHSLRREIADLRERAARRQRMRDEDGLLFETDDNGQKLGEPFCNNCFVKEDKLFRLVGSPWNRSVRYNCTNCHFVQLPESRRS